MLIPILPSQKSHNANLVYYKNSHGSIVIDLTGYSSGCSKAAYRRGSDAESGRIEISYTEIA